jgi:hypothetical protein
MNVLGRISLTLIGGTCSASIVLACSGAVAPAVEPSPDASTLPGGPDAGKDSSAPIADVGVEEEEAASKPDAAKSFDASDGAVTKVDADAGRDEDAPAPLNCADAGDIAVTCAQGAPCNCSSECSTSEGTGPTACALICSCDNPDNTGVFQCSQDCPPDAAPPADCNAGVTCVPGTECGGSPPVCLCNDKGILECPAGFDGG